MKAILIEDDSKKIDEIKEFFAKEFPDSELTVKESYQSGIRAMLSTSYDLLLLDMSIPTFDKTPEESGGPYEKFGGYKVMRETIRKSRSVKTILITMFDDFGESDLSITLSQINEQLRTEFNSIYLGSVFYHARETKWRDELKSIIETMR